MCILLKPEVLSAIAATFSCIATFGLLFMAYQTHQYVKKEDKLRFAKKIAMSVYPPEFGEYTFVTASIINNSGSTIYDVYLIGCNLEEIHQIKKLRGFDKRDIILPDENNIIDSMKTSLKAEVLGKSSISRLSASATLFFRDINGNEWCLDSNGRLTECKKYKKYFSKSNS